MADSEIQRFAEMQHDPTPMTRQERNKTLGSG
jgi:hypothetical protein